MTAFVDDLARKQRQRDLEARLAAVELVARLLCARCEKPRVPNGCPCDVWAARPARRAA